MKAIFTSEFFIQIVIQVILMGLIVFFVQNYFLRKWQPMTAAETLKKENFLNSKRDVFYEAIQIANREYAFIEFTDLNGNKLTDYPRHTGTSKPSEFEVNTCFSKLCIYADNKEIPRLFKQMFLHSPDSKPIAILEDLVNSIRKDLGYGDGIISPRTNEYEYISIPAIK